MSKKPNDSKKKIDFQNDATLYQGDGTIQDLSTPDGTMNVEGALPAPSLDDPTLRLSDENSDATFAQGEPAAPAPPITPSELLESDEANAPTRIAEAEHDFPPTLASAEPETKKARKETTEKKHDPAIGFQTDHQTLVPEAPSPIGPSSLLHPKLEGYEILGELGRGGMGVVYKAKQTGLNRFVALKMILNHSQAGRTDLRRFQAEAEVLAGLHHPNIVQIYEVGQHEGAPWFSLEMVEGGNLAERASQETITPEQSAKILLKLAEAMDEAHSKGVLHRDLKPANILMDGDLSAPLEQSTPRITDFGLAKRLDEDSSQTKDGTVMGTPSYMPPEQALGLNWQLGPPADIYSLGAILYDLLTGRPPFRGKTVPDTLHQVMHTDPRPPSQIQPKVPGDLQVICLKCLEKEPGDRYRSAKELADDLRAFLRGDTIKARPASFVERAWKWARRRPAIAALILVSLLSIIGFGVGAGFYAQEQTKAATREQGLRKQAEQAQNEAEKQAQIAKKQFRRAEANYRHAKEVVRQLTLIGHRRLKNVPHMEGVRRELLEQALRSQEAFLQINGDVPEQRAEVGRAHLRRSEILELLGKRKEAQQAARKALARFEALVKEQPTVDEHRGDLARTWNDLAILYQGAGKQAEAEAAFDKAIAEKTILLKNKPKSDKARRELANSYNNRGHLYQVQSNLPRAEKDYSTALDLLLKVDPEAAREDLARTWTNLGTAWVTTAPEKALSALSSAQSNWANLAAQPASDVLHRRELAVTHLNRGALHHMQKQVREADADYEKAIEIFSRLIKEFPKTLDYRELAVNAHVNRAQLQRSQKKPRLALKQWQAAVNLLGPLAEDFPNLPRFQEKLGRNGNELAISFTGAGRTFEAQEAWQAAIKVQEKLVKSKPQNKDYWRDLIDSYANHSGLLTAMSKSSKETEDACRMLLAAEQRRADVFPNNLQFDNDRAMSLHTLAVVLATRGKPEEAIQTLTKAVALQSKVHQKAKVPATAQALKSYIKDLESLLKKPGEHPIAEATIKEATRRLKK